MNSQLETQAAAAALHLIKALAFDMYRKVLIFFGKIKDEDF